MRGFTLIEVLVVVVILAVVVTVVTVTLGRDRGPARLQLAAERAQALITAHCRQNAILQGRLIGVVVDTHEYAFVSQFQDQWLPLNQVRNEVLAPGVSVWVSLDGRRAEVAEDDGEVVPKQLAFDDRRRKLEAPVNEHRFADRRELFEHFLVGEAVSRGRGGGGIDRGEVRP